MVLGYRFYHNTNLGMEVSQQGFGSESPTYETRSAQKESGNSEQLLDEKANEVWLQI